MQPRSAWPSTAVKGDETVAAALGEGSELRSRLFRLCDGLRFSTGKGRHLAGAVRKVPFNSSDIVAIHILSVFLKSVSW